MKNFECFSAEILGLKYFFDRNPSVFPDISARFLDRFWQKAIENPSYKTARFCRTGTQAYNTPKQKFKGPETQYQYTGS